VKNFGNAHLIDHMPNRADILLMVERGLLQASTKLGELWPSN